MWLTLAKVWLSFWITMIGLIEAGNEHPPKEVHPADQAEERLRQRWTAFVAEANKELTFDLNASSPRLGTYSNEYNSGS